MESTAFLAGILILVEPTAVSLGTLDTKSGGSQWMILEMEWFCQYYEKKKKTKKNTPVAFSLPFAGFYFYFIFYFIFFLGQNIVICFVCL